MFFSGRISVWAALIPCLALSILSHLAEAQTENATPKKNSSTPAKKAKLSREEELRQERMRMRGPAVIRYNPSGDAVVSRNGDLFLESKDGKSVQLTNTPGAEIAPQLTPDSKFLAYVREHGLYGMNPKEGKEIPLSPSPSEGLGYGEAEFVAQEEMDRFDGFWISPDAAWIVYQETDERHIPIYPIVHQGDDQWNVETHRYPFAGKANANVRLGVVSTSGGETRWISLLPDEGEQYLARVHWESPKSFLVEMLARDHKTLRMIRVDAMTGSNAVVFTEKAPDFINLHEDFRLVDEKSGEFLWASETSGFKHLELRSREGRIIRQLTSGPGAVDKVVKLFPDRREVWYMAWSDSPLESHLYRVSLDSGEPVRLTTEPGMHSATVNDDGESFTDQFSSFSVSSTTLKKDRNGKVIPEPEKDSDRKKSSDGSASSVKAAAGGPNSSSRTIPGLIDENPSGAKLIEFQSRDGEKLYGIYYPPANLKPGQKVPLIVNVYGGPHVQTVTNSNGLARDGGSSRYTSRGFAYWKMDNRGSSRRGKAFEAAIFRNMGDLEVRDQVDGVRHIAKLFPEIDTSRVGITGGSYGGYMTLRALTEAPETFHVGVSFAPVTDWDGYDTCYTERYMETPETNPDGYQKSSVLTSAEKIKGKLLLIHGMIDENVHYRHTARLVQALMAAKVPFELLAVPEGRHGFRRMADAAYAGQKTLSFFETHLLGNAGVGKDSAETRPAVNEKGQ
ncbi:MAG: hypothetical protein RJA81_2055 [Planctomycetota bacterium]